MGLFDPLREPLNRLWQKHARNFKLLAPITTVMVVSTLYLKECAQIKVDLKKDLDRTERTDALVDEYRKQKKFDKTAGYESQEEFELERKRLTDGLNLKTYSNIRGPREWEDGSFEKIQARYSEIVDKKAGAEGADK